MITLRQLVRNHIVNKRSKAKVAIPFIFTFANAFFGFFSIIKTIEGDFVAASLCIMAAAVMDGLDGRLARYLETTGQLGLELDSLCDAVSFCLAPAVLLYSWYLHDFGHVGFFISAIILYLCSGLFRLARFNLATSEQHVFFLGLPTTIAALFFAQLVLYQELFAHNPLHAFLSEQVLVGIVAFVALLMISSFRFPAFKKINIPYFSVSSFIKCILIGSTVVWCLSHGYPLFLIGITFYIVGSIILHIFHAIKMVYGSKNIEN